MEITVQKFIIYNTYISNNKLFNFPLQSVTTKQTQRRSKHPNRIYPASHEFRSFANIGVLNLVKLRIIEPTYTIRIRIPNSGRGEFPSNSPFSIHFASSSVAGETESAINTNALINKSRNTSRRTYVLHSFAQPSRLLGFPSSPSYTY